MARSLFFFRVNGSYRKFASSSRNHGPPKARGQPRPSG